MKKTLGFLLTILASNVIALSNATAQVTEGLTRAEAAALEDKVNNTVRESGTLESASSVELRSPIAGTIMYVTEEGTRVKKGDKLATLDSAAIENAIAIQKTQLAKSKADLIAAKSDLQTRELELTSAQSIGEKQIKVADMKLNLFRGEGGEYQTAQEDLAEKLGVAEKQIASATVALDEAKARLQGSGGNAAVKKAEAMLALARAESSALKREQKLQEKRKQIRIAEHELSILEHKTNLTTTTNNLQSELQQAKTKLEAARIAEDIEQSELDSLLEKLTGSVIHAPHDGVVLYTERRRGAELIEAGTTVRERQVILKVADLSKLQVALTVNETRVGRVQQGQKAIIRFDALINQGFQGTVIRVNRTPEAANFLQESGRKYKVIVSVQDPNPQLRVGMTAMVDIRTNK